MSLWIGGPWAVAISSCSVGLISRRRRLSVFPATTGLILSGFAGLASFAAPRWGRLTRSGTTAGWEDVFIPVSRCPRAFLKHLPRERTSLNMVRALGWRLREVVLQRDNLSTLRCRIAHRRGVSSADYSDFERLGHRAAQLAKLGDLVVRFPVDVLEVSFCRVDLISHRVIRSLTRFEKVCERVVQRRVRQIAAMCCIGEPSTRAI
ncbi:hypothetical protein [Mycolicibacterium peregrinum]|uniref:hypothetical protein n=1 Tax=Mycolicibacterium peregrinum TaxID=43304 RepID=UPI003AACD794